MLGAEQGADIVPVWNKSHREHNIVGSQPESVRHAADEAVAALGWERPHHVDADHINLGTVDGYLDSSDFYTIDVADSIGKTPEGGDVDAFLGRHPELVGRIEISGIDEPFDTSQESVAAVAAKYLAAVSEAGEIYRHIESRKGAGNFIPEVSMDETDNPQTPPELLVILAAVADEEIPIQTIAPKYHGAFQQGRRLCRRCRAVRKGVPRRPSCDRPRRRALRVAGQSQAKRAFGQRQIFDLRPDPRRLGPTPGRASTSRRPGRLGWKS